MPSSSCAGHTYLLCNVKEAKQLEEARLKLAREQKKRQDMESAGRLAAQRKAAEQAVRQQAEADMKQKKADRHSRVNWVPFFYNCSEVMTQHPFVQIRLWTP
jgi:hypothetical protein